MNFAIRSKPYAIRSKPVPAHMTERQQGIYDFLAAYIKQSHYSPTIREIGEAVGLTSPSSVHTHLCTLERMGIIQRNLNKPRSIRLLLQPLPTEWSAEWTPGSTLTERDFCVMPRHIRETDSGGELLRSDSGPPEGHVTWQGWLIEIEARNTHSGEPVDNEWLDLEQARHMRDRLALAVAFAERGQADG